MRTTEEITIQTIGRRGRVIDSFKVKTKMHMLRDGSCEFRLIEKPFTRTVSAKRMTVIERIVAIMPRLDRFGMRLRPRLGCHWFYSMPIIPAGGSVTFEVPRIVVKIA